MFKATLMENEPTTYICPYWPREEEKIKKLHGKVLQVPYLTETGELCCQEQLHSNPDLTNTSALGPKGTADLFQCF